VALNVLALEALALLVGFGAPLVGSPAGVALVALALEVLVASAAGAAL
jgi:hypothetical protein